VRTLWKPISSLVTVVARMDNMLMSATDVARPSAGGLWEIDRGMIRKHVQKVARQFNWPR
jgi:hypothetical protein